MIKLAPYIDISYLRKLFKESLDIYVISVGHSCKEVLLHFEEQTTKGEVIACWKEDKKESWSINSSLTIREESASELETSLPKKFLYEPNASIMKIGSFQNLQASYNLKKIHRHTHLFTSEVEYSSFPGYYWLIEEIIPFKSNCLKGRSGSLHFRNMPESFEVLVKKSGLKLSGTDHYFAFKQEDESLVVAKIQSKNHI